MKGILFVIISISILVCCVSAQQSWCGAQDLWFQHNSSISPAGYEELINYPSGNPEIDENVSVINTGGQVLIDSYITPIGSFYQTTRLEAGLRRFRTYMFVSSASGITTLNFTAFIRHLNGTETYRYSVTTDDINDLSVNKYLTSYAVPFATPLDPTDREVIKVYAQTTHSSPITVHWIYQGSTHASMLQSGYFTCESAIGGISSPNGIVPELPLPSYVAVAAIILCAIILGRKRGNL